MEKKYEKLQKELKKVKRSFKRQERTLNTFLEGQLQTIISEAHLLGSKSKNKNKNLLAPNLFKKNTGHESEVAASVIES